MPRLNQEFSVFPDQPFDLLHFMIGESQVLGKLNWLQPELDGSCSGRLSGMQLFVDKCTVRGIRQCLPSELRDDASGRRDSMSLGRPDVSKTVVLWDSLVVVQVIQVFGTAHIYLLPPFSSPA